MHHISNVPAKDPHGKQIIVQIYSAGVNACGALSAEYFESPTELRPETGPSTTSGTNTKGSFRSRALLHNHYRVRSGSGSR